MVLLIFQAMDAAGAHLKPDVERQLRKRLTVRPESDPVVEWNMSQFDSVLLVRLSRGQGI